VVIHRKRKKLSCWIAQTKKAKAPQNVTMNDTMNVINGKKLYEGGLMKNNQNYDKQPSEV
jgi:hypothetical protein